MAPKSRRNGNKESRRVQVVAAPIENIEQPSAVVSYAFVVSEKKIVPSSAIPVVSTVVDVTTDKNHQESNDVSQRLHGLYQHDPRYDDIRLDYEDLLIKSGSDSSIFSQKDVSDEITTAPTLLQHQVMKQLTSVSSLLDEFTTEVNYREASTSNSIKHQYNKVSLQEEIESDESSSVGDSHPLLASYYTLNEIEELSSKMSDVNGSTSKLNMSIISDVSTVQVPEEKPMSPRRQSKYKHVSAKINTNLSPKRPRKVSPAPKPVMAAPKPAPQVPYEALQNHLSSLADILTQISVTEVPRQELPEEPPLPLIEEEKSTETKHKVVTRWDADSPVKQWIEHEAERVMSPSMLPVRPGSPSRRRWQVPEQQQQQHQNESSTLSIPAPVGKSMSRSSSITTDPSSINATTATGSPAPRKSVMIAEPAVHSGTMATDLASFYSSLRGSRSDADTADASNKAQAAMARRKSNKLDSRSIVDTENVMDEDDTHSTISQQSLRDVQRKPYYPPALQTTPETLRRASMATKKQKQASVSSPTQLDSAVAVSPGHHKNMFQQRSSKQVNSESNVENVLQTNTAEITSTKSFLSKSNRGDSSSEVIGEVNDQEIPVAVINARRLVNLLSQDLVWQITLLVYLLGTFHILTADLSPIVNSSSSSFYSYSSTSAIYHRQPIH